MNRREFLNLAAGSAAAAVMPSSGCQTKFAGSTVCAPSRCALMTGLHCGHAYVRGNYLMDHVKFEGDLPIPADTITVAKILKRAGYTTGIVGKWGMGGPGTTGIPNKQGFDYFFGYLDQIRAHSYYPTHLWRNEEKVDLEANRNGRRETYSHDLLTKEALEFVGRNKQKPFFLYLTYTIPHAELAVPEDSLKQYEGKFPEEPFEGGNYRAQKTPRAAFAAMITRMDRDIGQIFRLLKQLGIDESTFVMFSSDNGPHKEGGADPEFFDSNGTLSGIKRDLYEGGIRVPTIARWPDKIKPCSVSDHISAFWDFLPTACELAGWGQRTEWNRRYFLPSRIVRQKAEAARISLLGILQLQLALETRLENPVEKQV